MNGLETKAAEVLSRCFDNVPFLDIKERRNIKERKEDAPSELMLTLRINDETQPCLVEVRNNGQPRYAREAVNQILRYQQDLPEAYGIFIAPYISPQSAAICQEANIGYADFAGNCFLSFQRVFIQKEGKSNPYPQKRYLRSLYSPKAERILRVLLTSPYKKWKTEELANEADVSLGLVSNIRKLLSDREWIDVESVGFSLSNPLACLEDWSQNYDYTRNQVLTFYSFLEPTEFEYQLGELCQREEITYAFTGFSGAARYAPTVRYQRVTAYIQADADILATSLGIKPVPSGANVNLLIPYDEGVFYNKQIQDGLQMATPVQIYLDLMSLRGRGQEAAEVLLDEVIKRQW